jgi:hypothetical protein
MEKLRIIVGGFIGLMPAGGVTWDYMQYPLGFSLMGHDVYYIEDTRMFPIYQKEGSKWDDCSSTVKHLGNVMNFFGMGDKWAYRDEASGKCFGLTEEKIKTICNSADVFVNISCSTYMRDEYCKIPVKILIDSDPMFTQIQYMSDQKFTPGEPGLKQMVDAHNFHFTFGEKIGTENCRIPSGGLQWLTTRQPICLSYWKTNFNHVQENSFTTLMNWTAGKKLYFDSDTWGQKDIEFNKFLNLPQKVQGIKLSMIINQTGGTDQTMMDKEITKAGWEILSPDSNASDWKSYQQFIQNSTGEFSVAKETYVKARTGWFSCRSACYLASGKPVITQDTGWTEFIPAGNGLFGFQNLEEAVSALQIVARDPQKHSKAAREIAEEFFDSNKVLNSLLLKIS